MCGLMTDWGLRSLSEMVGDKQRTGQGAYM